MCRAGAAPFVCGRPFTDLKKGGRAWDPISRLQLAEQEIDRVFGPGYAAAHPELVAAVMAAASSDYAVQLVARAIEHIAEALWSRRRLVPTRRGN